MSRMPDILASIEVSGMQNNVFRVSYTDCSKFELLLYFLIAVQYMDFSIDSIVAVVSLVFELSKRPSPI